MMRCIIVFRRTDIQENMSNRIIAIGDIHGHAKALSALLSLIQLQPTDTLVTLGDYIDRGPDSKGVLDQLIEIRGRCRLVALMGNHEEIMLDARRGPSGFDFWMAVGGDQALDSYGPGRQLGLVPPHHWAFLESLPLYHEMDGYFFVHANYAPNQYFQNQSSQTLLWLDLADLPGRHFSQKTAVVGHTPQQNGDILDLDHVVCIDTGCGHGGVLTALNVVNGRLWQVTEGGLPGHLLEDPRPHRV